MKHNPQSSFHSPRHTSSWHHPYQAKRGPIALPLHSLHQTRVLRSIYSSTSSTPSSTPRKERQGNEQENSKNLLKSRPAGILKDSREDHPEGDEHGEPPPAEQSDDQGPKGCPTPEENANSSGQREGHTEKKRDAVEPSVREDNPARKNEHGPALLSGTEHAVPWWAGAFGAVPDMEDGREARGFYMRRFCELFFPDNTDGATEAR